MIRDDDLNYPVLFPSNEQSRKLSRKYGYNEWMISRFLNYIPDPENLLDYIDNKENLHTYVRTNTLKINPTILKKRLVSKGFQLKDTILESKYGEARLDGDELKGTNRTKGSGAYYSNTRSK